MGLDWVVERKVIPAHAAEHQRLETVHQAAVAEMGKRRAAWERENGVKGYVVSSEGPTLAVKDDGVGAETFEETREGRTLADLVAGMRADLDSLTVCPWSTLGVPVVGRDPKADAWVRRNFSDVEPSQFRGSFASAEEALSALDGEPLRSAEMVPEENKVGLGMVTGISVGATSFRGKVLGFIPWLPRRFADEAYLDHDAPGLADYGARLMEVAKDFSARVRRSGGDPHCERSNEQVLRLTAAARWCLYWGVRGHGMWAWF
ncbi:MAG: hypothetical protein GY772_17565 [bacterium]|nr:hypothetical protein [bacterium]